MQVNSIITTLSVVTFMYRDDTIVLTILFRNKLVVFDSNFWPVELVKRKEITFDVTPQVTQILSAREVITGSAQDCFTN